MPVTRATASDRETGTAAVTADRQRSTARARVAQAEGGDAAQSAGEQGGRARNRIRDRVACLSLIWMRVKFLDWYNIDFQCFIFFREYLDDMYLDEEEVEKPCMSRMER